MHDLGVVVTIVGGLGVALNVIAYRRLKRAKRVFAAACALHERYMEKLNLKELTAKGGDPILRG